MAVRAVRHEIDAGRVVSIKFDSCGVNALSRPQCQQRLAERVPAYARQVGAAGAGARGRDDGVAGVAPKALKVGGLACAGLVELHHAFAQRYDIEIGRHIIVV
jgi:predicted Zn-dependent protease